MDLKCHTFKLPHDFQLAIHVPLVLFHSMTGYTWPQGLHNIAVPGLTLPEVGPAR